MSSDALANLTDEQVMRSTRRMSKAGRWLFLVTIVFFTLGVWVDLRWFAMAGLSTAISAMAIITAGVGSQELRERNPDFKWDLK